MTSRSFAEIPYPGVVQVMAEAAKRGFTSPDPEWCNLGQGQPEVGMIDGASEGTLRLGLARPAEVVAKGRMKAQ